MYWGKSTEFLTSHGKFTTMKNKHFLILCLLTFVAGVSIAQQVLTPESLWKLGRVSDPQLSPNGEKVVYSIRNYNLSTNKGNSDIWVYDIKKNLASAVTTDSSNETMPRWNMEGTGIYFLNDAGGSSQLWSCSIDGTNKKQNTKLEGDINLYGISPSGTMIWIAQDVKLDNFFGRDIYNDLPKSTGKVYDDLMMRHWDSWADGNYSHIFVAQFQDGKISGRPIDIMKDERFDTPMKPDGGEEQISWRPDGKVLAYTCKKYSGREYALNTNSDIYLYDVETKKTTNLTEGMVGYDKNPAFSPQGNQLVWESQAENGNEADRHRLFLYDFATQSKRELSSDFDFNVENPVWGSNGRRVYFKADIQATDQIFFYDMYNKSAHPMYQLTKDVADYTAISVASFPAKQDVIVASRMSMSEPTELFLIDAKTGTSKQITFTNKDFLSNYKLADVKKRMVKSTDGKEILTWVIYPPDFDPTKKYPTLLYCQGGPESTVSQFFSYRWNFQLMAANGYIIVAPNRRGLPGFGSKWNDEIVGDWGGQPMRDLLSAIDDVSKEPYVNKDKMGAVGASYGGFSVFWLAGHHEKRFKAFISHCGVFNFEAMWGTEELFFQNKEFQGPYWQSPVPKSYNEFSPNRFVQNWDTPIMIISNEKDYRIPYSQGLEAFSAARMKNIPARFICFPDEGHWVLKPQNSVLWQREFYDWLDKYLK